MYAGVGARPQQPQFGNPYGGGYGGQAPGGAYGGQAGLQGAPYAQSATQHRQAPPPSFPANPAPAAAKPPAALAVSAAPAMTPAVAPAPAPVVPSGPSLREQMLEQKNRELENIIAQKDRDIQDIIAQKDRDIQELQQQLQIVNQRLKQTTGKEVRSPRVSGMSGGGRNNLQMGGDSKPMMPYQCVAPDDPTDQRLEEFYNSTGSAIQFRRINRGFYRFGETIVELDIINHKLMGRTEDGWNRGKFGPVERFLKEYENIERDKAGIQGEA